MLIYSKRQNSFINLQQLLEIYREGAKIVAVSPVKDQADLFIAKILEEYETEEKAKQVLEALVKAYVAEKRMYAMPQGLELPLSSTGAPSLISSISPTSDSAQVEQAP